MSKRRYPLAAFALGIVPGLGQLYNGQVPKALLILVGYYILSMILLIYGFFYPLRYLGWNITIALFYGYALATMLEAAFTAARLKTTVLARYHRWYSYLAFTVAYAAILWLGVHFVMDTGIARARTYSIPSSSMEPWVRIGDTILVAPHYYDEMAPQRGDVVVFDPPPAANAGGKAYIKRVLGLPGETVRIEGHQIYINGRRLADHYKFFSDSPGFEFLHEYGPCPVPPGHLFLIGDNRNNSADSRAWGTVPIQNLKGKAIFVLTSTDPSRNGLEFP